MESEDGLERFAQACSAGNATSIRELCEKDPGLVSDNLGERHGAGGGTGLHLTAKNCHPECCAVLLDRGAYIEALDYMSRTPLLCALDCEVLELLLSRGANVNATAGTMTVFHTGAFEKWSRRAAQLLVSADADVTKTSLDGDTPVYVTFNLKMAVELEKLMRLARRMDIEISRSKETVLSSVSRLCFEVSVGAHIQALVAAGANLEAADGQNRTPLLTAAFNNNKHACRKLLELGADVNAKSVNGNTALHLAAMHGHCETVVELLTHGANVEAKNLGHNTALHLAVKSGRRQCVTAVVSTAANIVPCNDNGYTALPPGLAQEGTQMQVQMVRVLIEAGAEVQVENKHGRTPLIYAARCNNPELIEELLKAGANPSACDKYGLTALLEACKYGCIGTARALVASRTGIEARDRDGNTPLLLALRNGYTQLAIELIDAGADVNARNGNGNTALALAFERRENALCYQLVEGGAEADRNDLLFPLLENAVITADHDFLQLFLRIKANDSVNVRGTGGLTVLHVAARCNNFDAVKWLLHHGADPCASADNGFTPLHSISAAAKSEQIQISRLLLARGANPIAKSNQGETPLALAKEKQRFSPITAILEKAEVAHQLIEIGGEARKPSTVAIRFGGPPGAGKSTLTKGPPGHAS